MKEKVILTPENGDDVVLLLKGILEFVEETSVSHGNKTWLLILVVLSTIRFFRLLQHKMVLFFRC